MKIMWCWRCKRDVAMLDEEEYSKIHDIYMQCVRSVKKYRETNGTSLQDTPLNDLYAPVREEYEHLSGFTGVHPDEILHHRINNFGQPCRKCGKPLRSPRAKMCVVCGTRTEEVE